MKATETISLANLASFVTNSHEVVKVKRLSLQQIDALADLFLSGAEIELLAFCDDVFGTVGALSQKHRFVSALRGQRNGGILRTLCLQLCCVELAQTLAEAAAGPGLESLQISSPVLDLDHYLVVGKVIRNCTDLKQLHISSYLIQASEIAPELAKLRWLESVSFVHVSDLGDTGTEQIALAVGINPRLRSLTLESSRVTSSGVSFLGKMRCFRALKSINLAENYIGDSGVTTLVAGFLSGKFPVALEKLQMQYTRMGPLGLITLTQLISKAPSLRVLDVSRNQVGEEVGELMGSAIRRSCSGAMEKLIVTACELGEKGTIALFTQLRGVDIDCVMAGQNKMGDAGAKALAEFVLKASEKGEGVAELEIDTNEISSVGAMELANVLISDQSIVSLNINNNPLGLLGAAAIVDSLARAGLPPMRSLLLEECMIQDLGAAAVGRLIRVRKCGRINLCYNWIGIKGIKAITEAAEEAHATVDVLNLSQNLSGSEAAKLLAEKMIRTNRVQVLFMEVMNTKDEGAVAIAKAVRERDPSMQMEVVLGTHDFGEIGEKELRETQQWERGLGRDPVIMLTKAMLRGLEDCA